MTLVSVTVFGRPYYFDGQGTCKYVNDDENWGSHVTRFSSGNG